MGLKIQRPFIAEALQRLFRLTGSIQMQLEPFVVGTVQLADLSLGSEPPISRAANASFFQAAVVGEVPVWRLEIPGSAIMHVKSIELLSATSSKVFALFGSTIPPPAATAVKSMVDGRLLAESQLAAGVLTFGTQVANLNPIQWRGLIVADVPRVFRPNAWIVGTGEPDVFGFLEMQLNVPNIGVDVNVEWDEYQIV